MATTPTTEAQEAALLKQFQALTSYGERKAFFEANPFLARIYCPSNFSAPAPVKAEPAPVSAPTTQP